jgi:cation transport ATPase
MLLFQISHSLEEKFTSRARGSVERLFSSVPTQVGRLLWILRKGGVSKKHGPSKTLSCDSPSGDPSRFQATLVEMDAALGRPLLKSASKVLARSVSPGQHVLIKPGEQVREKQRASDQAFNHGPCLRPVLNFSASPHPCVPPLPPCQVPLDGVVAWGAAGVSMAHISGESRPSRVAAGDEVPAGSLNTDGLIVVRVTATADESTPARIARLTAAAQVSGREARHGPTTPHTHTQTHS